MIRKLEAYGLDFENTIRKISARKVYQYILNDIQTNVEVKLMDIDYRVFTKLSLYAEELQDNTDSYSLYDFYRAYRFNPENGEYDVKKEDLIGIILYVMKEENRIEPEIYDYYYHKEGKKEYFGLIINNIHGYDSHEIRKNIEEILGKFGAEDSRKSA